MSRTIIKITTEQVEAAWFISGRETGFEQSLTQCQDDSRAIGVIGEMAATEFLRGMHGVKRSVVPMGLAARTGGGRHTYGMGDIITVKVGSPSQRSKEVHTFEVKARRAGVGKGNIIRCDSAEQYVAQGIDRVIFVDVDLQESGAVCSIAGYIQPHDILNWKIVTNGMGHECFVMPA